ERPVTIREDAREAVHRREPHLGLTPARSVLATGDGHGPSLHLFVARDANLQRPHGNTPRSFRTASTSDQQSASRAAASVYSYGRTVRSRCLWSRLVRPRPEGPPVARTGCALSKHTKRGPSSS